MEKYIQYKALDFAEDPAFIQWVQSGFQNQDSIWNQLKNHSADLNNEIEEAIAIVSIFKLKEDPPANKAKEDALFNRIENTIAGQQSIFKPVVKQKKGIVRFLGPIAIAAAMAMLIFFFLPRPDLKTFSTNIDQSKVEHILPDQSIIVLAANSTISYVDGGKFNKKRRVKLEGKAFFKVQKGEQFIVDTRHGKVEVLGTTFSVDASSGLYVHCVTGKVKVSNQSSSTINTNGETSILADGKIKKQGLDKEKLSWYITKYEFKEEPLKKVLDKLKQEYQIEIQSSAATDSLAYTGFFETGNLDEALRAITWPLGLTFEVNGEKVTIKK